MKLIVSLTLSFFSIVIITVALVNINRGATKPSLVLGQIVTTTPTPTKNLNAVKISDQELPLLTAQSAVVLDIKSKTLLLDKNSTLRLYPASNTKLATALVAMDYYPLDRVLKVDGVKVEGQKMKLLGGETITVADLIRGLLMFSANDAAEVLANSFPGGKANFVSAMNLKVSQLNLADTVFENPTGLDNENQYTTAFDLAKMANYAIERPFIAQTVRTKKAIVTSTDRKVIHNLTNINELLGVVPGVLGIKTGWTENAKENLVTYIERDNGKLIIVVLGSDDRFGETKKIIDWVFESYKF